MNFGFRPLTNNCVGRKTAFSPTRRMVLEALCAGGAVLIGLRRPGSPWPGSPTEMDILRLKLSSVFSDVPGAKRLGALYLEHRPTEIDPLFTQFRDLAFEDSESIVRILSAQRAADFATRRTVVLDGWVLARSEAQACALLCSI